MIEFIRRARHSPWLIASVLLLVALLPRLPALGTFAGADEPFWVEQSLSFAQALLRGDWSNLFQSPHPGIPPMAGYGLTLRLLVGDIDRYHINYQADMPRLLATAALFDVLVAAWTVVGVYALVRKLFGNAPAVLAGLLVALDPYFVGLSRTVSVDAILASLVTLAVLALAAYLVPTQRRRAYLTLAVLCGVLAFLTKLPALMLLPYGLVCMGLATIGRSRREVLRWGLVLLVVVLLVVVLLGVAVLVMNQVIDNIYLERIVRATRNTIVAGFGVPHEGGSYFLGEPGRMLDWTFYLWLLLLKTTPFSLVGAGLAVVMGLRSWRCWREPEIRALVLLTLFVAAYTTAMALGAKKQDRYILPTLPVLDVVAAWGWWATVRWVGRYVRRTWSAMLRFGRGGALAGLVCMVLLTSLTWLRLYPYFIAYYNPLIGGSKTAAWVYAVGWGEGLDQAAAYLNRQADATDLLVAGHNAWVLGSYCQGNVVQLTAQNHYVADYVVFYYADALRNVPEPWVIDRFRSQQPAFVAWIDGVPYAGVYRNLDLPQRLVSRHRPAVGHPLDVTLGRWVRCVGVDLTEKVSPGMHLPVTFHWECLELMSVDYYVFVHLVDEAGRVWEQTDHEPLQGHLGTSFWQPGLFLRDEMDVAVPEDAPPGTYMLTVGLYNPRTGHRLPVSGTGADHFTIGPVTVE